MLFGWSACDVRKNVAMRRLWNRLIDISEECLPQIVLN